MDRSPSLEARLMFSFAVFGVFWGGWGALLPQIKDNVDATDATLGASLLFIALGAVIGMLTAGRLYDRFGPKVIPPAHVVFALATIPPALARRPLGLIPALLFLGVTTGMLDVVINGATAAYETRARQHLMGRVHAMFSLGVLIAGGTVGAVRDVGASELAILGPIAVLIVVAAIMTRAVGLPRATEERGPSPRTTRAVLILGSLCGLAFLIEDGMLSWSAIHLEQTLGARPSIGGLGPASLAGAMVVGRLLTSRITARFHDRSVIAGGGLVAAAGACVAAVAPVPVVALIGIVLTGAGISVCAPLIFSLAGRSAPPDRQGAVISRVTTIAYTGFILGPPLVGGIAGIASLRVGIVAIAVVALALAAGSRLAPAAM
ncbi:MAG: MFS transporter [Actinomycetota bacterium]